MGNGRRDSDNCPDRGTDLAALGAQQERERQEQDRQSEREDRGNGRYVNGRYHKSNCDCRHCEGDFT